MRRQSANWFTRFLSISGVILLTSSGWASVNLTADVNRDGVIDPVWDEDGEDAWTARRGAIFLNNCDSDLGTGKPDHGDAVVNGIADMMDLARIHLGALPGLAETARVTVSVDDASRRHVRLFNRIVGDAFVSVDLESEGNVYPEQVADGDVEFGIEARQFADALWNGETTVTVKVAFADGTMETDSVVLRVAPFLMLSSLQKGEVVYVRDFPGRNGELIAALGELVPAAGARLYVIPDSEKAPYAYNHIWLQDTMEIGYTEMPGSRMSVVMPANRNKSLDNFAADELLGPDFGWIRIGNFRADFGAGEGGKSWMDWYGNLEVTPPLPGYPMGRIYYGHDGPDTLNPDVVAMLDAQGFQKPVALDVGWLLIKHVDEMICFVPSKEPGRPLRILVPDPSLAVSLIRKWETMGYGDMKLLGPYGDPSSRHHLGALKKYPVVTVGSLAGDTELMGYNMALAAERIEPMIRDMLGKFGLDESVVIRVPYLQSPEREAILPNMVNSVVLNGHLLVADPHGPVVDGVDKFKEYMGDALREVDLDVHYVDDRQYHFWSGNVHCATNVKREGFSPSWWTKAN